MKQLIRAVTAVAATLVLAATFPSVAGAQWVRLQRCGSALPCAIPFGVRYAPDPLIAVRIDEPHVSLELADFSEQAARKFVLAHPPPNPPPPPK